MKFRIVIAAATLAVACGAMNGGGGNGGSGGNGGGANGGTGGGGSGGTGGGATGGTGGGGSGGAGGSGGVGVIPDWTSGTRLRAKVLTSPDGAKAFGGIWHDTQLNLDCYAQIAGDGQRRCLPSTGAYIQTFYSDTSCSSPLAYELATTASACAPTVAIAYETGTTCGDYGQPANKLHLYNIAGVYNGTVYSKSGATCSAYTNTGTLTFFNVGAEVAPSTYSPLDYVVE